MSIRTQQCKACPWKKGVKPREDIPGGYCEKKHEALRDTIAEPGAITGLGPSIRMMACHESPVDHEQPCVGWVINQLGPGNNIALRMLARDGRFRELRVEGPQHDRFEDTLPKRARRRR
jgi:hypothetical protein